MIQFTLFVAVLRMLIRRLLRLALCVPALVLGFGMGVVCAQTVPSASQITPPNFRPSDRLPQGGLLIPDSSSIEVPRGAEKLRVWIGRVEYSGGRPELESIHQEISKHLGIELPRQLKFSRPRGNWKMPIFVLAMVWCA